MIYHNLHPALVLIALALIGAGLLWAVRAIVFSQINHDRQESAWRRRRL